MAGGLGRLGAVHLRMAGAGRLPVRAAGAGDGLVFRILPIARHRFTGVVVEGAGAGTGPLQRGECQFLPRSLFISVISPVCAVMMPSAMAVAAPYLPLFFSAVAMSTAPL